jgi:hypothetical protein
MEYIVAITVNNNIVNVTVTQFDGSDKSLSQLYKIIGCKLVDFVEITLDNDEYDLWFDNNYLQKKDAVLTWYDPTLTWTDQVHDINNPMIVMGNAVIAKSNTMGETIGMTYEEASFVAMKYAEYMRENFPKFIEWLKNVKAKR